MMGLSVVLNKRCRHLHHLLILGAFGIGDLNSPAQAAETAQGWWGGDSGYCSPTYGNLGMCSTAFEACQSWAAFRYGTLASMTSRYDSSSGAFLGYSCAIADPWPASATPEVTFLYCPTTGGPYVRTPSGCKLAPPLVEGVAYRRAASPCEAGSGNRGTAGPVAGNPAIIGNGEKIEAAVDFASGGSTPLVFQRFYNGSRSVPGSLGAVWASNFDGRLTFNASGGIAYDVYVTRPTGERMRFSRRTVGGSTIYQRRVDGTWIKDSIESLTWNGTAWEFRDADDLVETYDTTGRLRSIQHRGGYGQFLAYNETQLSAVFDSLGRRLQFGWDGDRLASMTDPSGRVTRYLYDTTNPATSLRLEEVIYPDATSGTDADNPRITYHYEDTTWSYALTGATDERGVRFATWSYDGAQRIATSQHAGGADLTSLGYDDTNRRRTVTNALGKDTTYHFSVVQQAWKLNRVEGEASTNCAAADQYLTYDTNGFVASRTDWNGNVTSYVNDARGLPTSITEAVGTGLARTRTITWHGTFRLPTEIVEPGRTTTFTYDAAGNLLTRTETDTTSHSVPYSTNGQSRSWTFGYDDVGPAIGTPTSPVAVTLTNPGAESGSLAGWTVDATGFGLRTSSPAPHTGSYYFTGGASAAAGSEVAIYQDVALPSTLHAQIDNGRGQVRLGFWSTAKSPHDDLAAARLQFLDGSGNPIGDPVDGSGRWSSSWTSRSLSALLPPQTRSVRIRLRAIRDDGDTSIAALFDDVSLTYEPLLLSQAKLVASIDGPRTDVSDVTSFAYDDAGNLTSVTNALSQVTQITDHDARGLPLTVVDPNGIESTLAYDDRGRLLSVVADSGSGGIPATTAFTYDEIGQITRVTLPDASYLDYTYDAARRLIRIANALGEKIEYGRDAMGNATGVDVKTSGGSIVRSQTATFDELGRLLQDIGASAQITAYGWDDNDNLTSVTDPLTHTTSFAFDALDRLVQATDALSGETDLTYDGQDNLASLADPRSVTTSFVRNGFGEAIQETSPDRGTTVHVYDAAGNRTQRTDGRGVVANYTYDALDRLTEVAFPATPALDRDFGWDGTAGGNPGIGRLTSLTDAQGSASYVYDARGNPTGETRVIGGQSYDTAYSWDLADNLASITYPSGRIVTYARDSLGRITGVTTRASAGAPLVTLASSITWRPFGPIAGMSLGNGLAVSFGYDADGRLTDIDTTPGIQDLALTWDDAARNTAIADGVDAGRSQTLGYDALDRLTSAAGGYGSLTYAWDAGSNRSSRSWTEGGVTVTDTDSVSGSSNRLLSVARGGQTRTLGHDAAGNVTADTRFDGTVFGYAYDDDGRLASVTRNGLAEAAYGYDAFQRRVLKSSGGLTRHFLYDPEGYLLAEAGSAGDVTSEWIWLGDRPLAVVADVDTMSPRLLWLHSDHLGTPQQLTDQAGNLAWDAVLEPFGELADLVVDLVDQPLRLPGQQADPETGLHHNWHRDYDPSLARYLQPDPLGITAGTNLYTYAHANPVSWIDRDGRNPVLLGGIIVRGLIAIPPILAFWYEYGAPAIQGWWDHGFPEGTYCPLPDRWYSEGADESRPKPLLGSNPRETRNRTNTDLPGGRDAAERLFDELSRGQKKRTEDMDNGGTRTTSEDGIQIRRNPDGSTRIDVPGRGPQGRETIHYGTE